MLEGLFEGVELNFYIETRHQDICCDPTMKSINLAISEVTYKSLTIQLLKSDNILVSYCLKLNAFLWLSNEFTFLHLLASMFYIAMFVRC